MNKLLVAIFFLALTSCMKKTPVLISKTTSDDALLPLKYHAVSFKTNYPVVAGQVPPFTFTKTLYPDTRVKTLDMLSRAFPNHPSYPVQAYRLKGTFYYSTNAAKFVGTREYIQYSKGSKGEALQKSIATLPITYNFVFDKNGNCTDVIKDGEIVCQANYGYPDDDPRYSRLLTNIYMPIPHEPYKNEAGLYYGLYNDNLDTYKIYALYDPRYGYNAEVNFTYNTQSSSTARRLYIPTQYTFSQEYSLLEVMQWGGSSMHERTGVTVNFATADASARVVQGQKYYNHKYDANGNLVSYTYGDRVEQKIVWQ